MGKQQTMFDTALSKAADELVEVDIEIQQLTEKRKNAMDALINEMKRVSQTELDLVDHDGRLRMRVNYDFVDAQEKLICRRFKPVVGE